MSDINTLKQNMRFDAKISCRDLSNYTIYFLIITGCEAELRGGEKEHLSNPEDENFTARAGHKNIRFEDINYFYFNLPLLEKNGKIYDSLNWWGLLTKTEQGNLKSIYAPGLTKKGDEFSNIIIKYIYRQLLLDQFNKEIIQIPEYEKYLNWWKLLPWKTREKILFENLKPKHHYTYTLDDVVFLYNLPFPELDHKKAMSILLWWFNLDDNKKINLIHKHIEAYFHITAPSIDQIQMLFDNFK